MIAFTFEGKVLYIRGVHSVGSNVANSIRFVSLLDRIFSIRLAAKSNVEYSTSIYHSIYIIISISHSK